MPVFEAMPVVSVRVSGVALVCASAAGAAAARIAASVAAVVSFDISYLL